MVTFRNDSGGSWWAPVIKNAQEAGAQAEFKAKVEEAMAADRRLMEARFSQRMSRLQRLYRLKITRSLRHRPLNYKFERRT